MGICPHSGRVDHDVAGPPGERRRARPRRRDRARVLPRRAPRTRRPVPLGLADMRANVPTYRGLLLRGVGAGAVSGLLAGLVGVLVVGPPIRAALAVEQARPVEPGGHGHGELFSRGTQVVGGVLAAVLVGVAVGALFATAYAGSRRWFASQAPFVRAVTLSAAVFGAAALLPAVKYP